MSKGKRAEVAASLERGSAPDVSVSLSDPAAADRCVIRLEVDVLKAQDAPLVWEGVGLVLAGALGRDEAIEAVNCMQIKLQEATAPKGGAA
jgi:hypothetical protein